MGELFASCDIGCCYAFMVLHEVVWCVVGGVANALEGSACWGLVGMGVIGYEGAGVVVFLLAATVEGECYS
jgi:hypothetical protein